MKTKCKKPLTKWKNPVNLQENAITATIDPVLTHQISKKFKNLINKLAMNRKHSYTVGGNANWYNFMEVSLAIFIKITNANTHWPQNSAEIYPLTLVQVQNDTHTKLFNAAMFVIAESIEMNWLAQYLVGKY